MESTIKDLKERRSVRKYTSQMPPRQLIEEIIEAGMYAPNGMGRQSAIIVAITDKETRDKLSKLNARVLGTKIDPFYGAPVVLAVLADKNSSTRIEDGSLVLGNMLNAAHALGLGGCWIHRAKEVFNTEEGYAILETVNVPDNYVGIGHCVIGYAAEPPSPPKERKADYVYYI